MAQHHDVVQVMGHAFGSKDSLLDATLNSEEQERGLSVSETAEAKSRLTIIESLMEPEENHMLAKLHR